VNSRVKVRDGQRIARRFRRLVQPELCLVRLFPSGSKANHGAFQRRHPGELPVCQSHVCANRRRVEKQRFVASAGRLNGCVQPGVRRGMTYFAISLHKRFPRGARALQRGMPLLDFLGKGESLIPNSDGRTRQSVFELLRCTARAASDLVMVKPDALHGAIAAPLPARRHPAHALEAGCVGALRAVRRITGRARIAAIPSAVESVPVSMIAKNLAVYPKNQAVHVNAPIRSVMRLGARHSRPAGPFHYEIRIVNERALRKRNLSHPNKV
jgi:hypothetical protein